MSYVNYSDSQKQAAAEVDMLDFLNKTYGYQFKKCGREFHCTEHDSLVINQNRRLWYWNSQQVGGSGAVDWMMKMEKKSYPEAMYALVGKGSDEHYEKFTKAAAVNEAEKKELELPPQFNGQYKKVFAYLSKTRHIDSNIIAALMKENKIYQDDKNNAVFVGYDDEKKPRYACVRGTLSDIQYRGDCTGSDKSYPFSYVGNDASSMFIFESPIDMMSHATMFNKMSQNPDMWKEHTRISLSCTADPVLSKFLETHKEIKNIYICLDNDEAGIKGSNKIAEKYSELGYNTQILPPKTKDYNSDLAVFISSQANTISIQKQNNIN